MAIHYSGTTIGTFTLCQKREEVVDGNFVDVKDSKGRPVYNKFKIQIRLSNCLMCAIHVHKVDNPSNPKLCWRHDLVCFLVDEKHLKNCMKNYNKGYLFRGLFSGELKDIKLNMYYKDCKTLLNYMVRDGLKVQCYYKEDNGTK